MISLNPLKLNRCDCFIILWVIYYLQGTLYAEGGIIGISLLGINLLISAICALKVFQMRDTPIYFRGLGLLLVLFTIYGFALIVSHPGIIHYPSGREVPSFNYIKNIYLSMLPTYAFYYFSRKGYLTAGRLRAWFLIFFISCIYSYIHYRTHMIEFKAKAGAYVEEITNNAGYLFLSLIPIIVFFRKRPLLQYISLAAILLFVVLSMKRGAIIICAVTTAYFFWELIRQSHGRRKVALFMLTTLLCIATVYFVIYWISVSDYMERRIEDTLNGNSSGRDNLYEFFWTYFTKGADLLQYFFGRGANGTLEIYKNYAHNDWLEIAVNQGLVGVVIYAYYWLCFYKTWKQATNPDAKLIIALIGIIYFAKTLFSMSYGDMTYVSTSVFGYTLANYKYRQLN